MTIEQIITLVNAGYTKQEIANMQAPAQVQQAPAQVPAQVQQAPAQVQQAPTQVPAQVQQAPAQVQQAPAQVQQAPAQVPAQIQQAPAQVQRTIPNQPVNAAGTTDRLLDIIQELQKSNLKLASSQGGTPAETAEDALLSIIQETKGGK